MRIRNNSFFNHAGRKREPTCFIFFMTHALKTWPEYYKAVESGQKNFEVRRNDRPFKVGDTLLLQEWDNKKEEYTDKELRKGVTYILKGRQEFGIFGDYVVMGLKDKDDF